MSTSKKKQDALLDQLHQALRRLENDNSKSAILEAESRLTRYLEGVTGDSKIAQILKKRIYLAALNEKEIPLEFRAGLGDAPPRKKQKVTIIEDEMDVDDSHISISSTSSNNDKDDTHVPSSSSSNNDDEIDITEEAEPLVTRKSLTDDLPPEILERLFGSGIDNVWLHLRKLALVSKTMRDEQFLNRAVHSRPYCLVRKDVDMNNVFLYDQELNTTYAAIFELGTLDPLLAYYCGEYARIAYLETPRGRMYEYYLPSQRHFIYTDGFDDGNVLQDYYASIDYVDFYELFKEGWPSAWFRWTTGQMIAIDIRADLASDDNPWDVLDRYFIACNEHLILHDRKKMAALAKAFYRKRSLHRKFATMQDPPQDLKDLVMMEESLLSGICKMLSMEPADKDRQWREDVATFRTALKEAGRGLARRLNIIDSNVFAHWYYIDEHMRIGRKLGRSKKDHVAFAVHFMAAKNLDVAFPELKRMCIKIPSQGDVAAADLNFLKLAVAAHLGYNSTMLTILESRENLHPFKLKLNYDRDILASLIVVQDDTPTENRGSFNLLQPFDLLSLCISKLGWHCAPDVVVEYCERDRRRFVDAYFYSIGISDNHHRGVGFLSYETNQRLNDPLPEQEIVGSRPIRLSIQQGNLKKFGDNRGHFEPVINPEMERGRFEYNDEIYEDAARSYMSFVIREESHFYRRRSERDEPIADPPASELYQQYLTDLLLVASFLKPFDTDFIPNLINEVKRYGLTRLHDMVCTLGPGAGHIMSVFGYVVYCSGSARSLRLAEKIAECIQRRFTARRILLECNLLHPWIKLTQSELNHVPTFDAYDESRPVTYVGPGALAMYNLQKSLRSVFNGHGEELVFRTWGHYHTIRSIYPKHEDILKIQHDSEYGMMPPLEVVYWRAIRELLEYYSNEYRPYEIPRNTTVRLYTSYDRVDKLSERVPLLEYDVEIDEQLSAQSNFADFVMTVSFLKRCPAILLWRKGLDGSVAQMFRYILSGFRRQESDNGESDSENGELDSEKSTVLILDALYSSYGFWSNTMAPFGADSSFQRFLKEAKTDRNLLELAVLIFTYASGAKIFSETERNRILRYYLFEVSKATRVAQYNLMTWDLMLQEMRGTITRDGNPRLIYPAWLKEFSEDDDKYRVDGIAPVNWYTILRDQFPDSVEFVRM